MEINIVPKFIDEAAGVPAKAVGNTLTDIWNLGIGNHVALWSKKQEVRQQKNLADYKTKIEQKTQSIPEENLIEPKLHIIGPAIEASKYYIESDILQELFANLIASSIDNRKAGKTHPSFVEVIKQLSPLDAINLDLLQGKIKLPIAQYVTTSSDRKPFLTHNTNVFISNAKVENVQMNAVSLDNLTRLGLVKLDYTRTLSGFDYGKFKDTKEYKQFQYAIKELLNKEDTILHGHIIGGIISLTPMGEVFCEICIQ